MKQVNRPIWKAGLIAFFLIAFGVMVTDIAFAQMGVTDPRVAKSSAKLYIKQRLYDKAIEMLQVAVEKKPEDTEAQWLLGWLYSEKGLTKEMNVHFDYLLASKKGTKKYGKDIQQQRNTWWTRYYNNGVKALTAKDFNGALEAFQDAKSVIPNRADTFKGMGIAYLALGNTEEGIQSYQKAISMDSTDTGAYMNLGIAYMNSGKPEEAIVYFEKGHKLNPKDLNLLRNMGVAQQQAGDREGALKSAEKALEVDPENLQVMNMAGTMYLVGDNAERAAELLGKVVEKQPENTDAVFNLAAAYKKLKKFEEARALFQKSLDADPKDADAWYQLGLVHKNMADVSHKDAKELDEALSKQPNSGEIKAKLAAARAKVSQQLDPAIEAFQKYTDLKPADAKGWRALMTSSALKSQAVQGKEAEKWAKKAEEAYNMAEALANKGSE